MRSITSLFLILVLLAGGYRFLASIIVKDGAEVIFPDNACPVPRVPEKLCTIHGSISTDFISGDMLIETEDGTTWMIPQTQVRGVIYPAGQAKYKLQPTALLFLVTILGGLVMCLLGWYSLHRRTRNQP